MTRRGTVEIRAGANLATVISRTLAKDFYAAILELVSNSYDADAENVDLRVSTLEDRLALEDDGTGMDRDDLAAFYRLGDSTKLSNPVSGKGRRRIGKFGIATVLLEYLAGSYTLETWKDGQKITVHEDFADTKKGKSPKTKVEHSAKKTSGTRITMQKLRCDERTMNPDRLRSILEWEVPCLPDFNILLNGILVAKRSVRYRTEYDVNESIPGVGKIEGSVYYLDKKPAETPGIFVYVNGRAVGDPALFNQHMSGSMSNKVIGVIHANGLERDIGFDRSRFREDSKRYIAVREAIGRIITSIKHDVERFIGNRDYYARKSREVPQVQDALSAAEERLNRTLTGENQGRPYRLELKLDEAVPWASRFDDTRSVIYINAANPQLAKPDQCKSKELYAHTFMMLAIAAIAESRLNGSPRREDVLRTLSAHSRTVGQDLFADMTSLARTARLMLEPEDVVAVPVNSIVLNPYRLYEIREISQASGVDINTLTYLVAAGVMKARKESREGWKFLKDGIISALRRIEGYVPLARLLDCDTYMRPIRTSNQDPFLPIEERLAQEKKRPSYVKNMGKTHPLFFVERDRTSDAVRLYAPMMERKK